MRSTEPRMARCTMTGVPRPSSIMYDSLNLQPSTVVSGESCSLNLNLSNGEHAPIILSYAVSYRSCCMSTMLCFMALVGVRRMSVQMEALDIVDGRTNRRQ